MSKQYSWRNLIYCGRLGMSGWHQFAAESETARLDGRGGLGWLAMYKPAEDDPGDAVECNCPAFKDGDPASCWHVREAPKAWFYWSQRNRFTAMSREDFDAFYAKWWPKYRGILGAAKRDGHYKGQDPERWDLFYAALLNEWAARAAADGKVKQAGVEPAELTVGDARFVAQLNRTFGVKREVA